MEKVPVNPLVEQNTKVEAEPVRPVVGEKLPYTNNLPIIEQERP